MPAGDYARVREIGAGSFGRAYLVQKSSDRRFLVIKEIDVSKMNDKERAAADTEAKVLSSLKHPYIVRYRESFVTATHLCIVMDYCEGGDLWQYIRSCRQRASPIPEGTVIRWFTQMSLGLKYMHDRHVLHRDLKSQNMFLTSKDGKPQSCVKIADFGIAKVLGEGRNAFARTVIGTPYYLSPEMCQKQPYSWTSDVWALGCVLYELCALRVPFDAEDFNQLVQRICRCSAPRIPCTYTKELGDLGAELLAREHCRRPTAAALIMHPLLQVEIKRMLVENREGRDGHNENKDQILGKEQHMPPKDPKDGRPPRAVEALGERNAAHAGPSPRAPSPAGGLRAASPHRGAAKEVLKPSKAPTPGLPR